MKQSILKYTCSWIIWPFHSHRKVYLLFQLRREYHRRRPVPKLQCEKGPADWAKFCIARPLIEDLVFEWRGLIYDSSMPRTAYENKRLEHWWKGDITIVRRTTLQYIQMLTNVEWRYTNTSNTMFKLIRSTVDPIFKRDGMHWYVIFYPPGQCCGNGKRQIEGWLRWIVKSDE